MIKVSSEQPGPDVQWQKGSMLDLNLINNLNSVLVARARKWIAASNKAILEKFAPDLSKEAVRLRASKDKTEFTELSDSERARMWSLKS